jgi:PAS domain S-box-containing protein
VPIRGINLQQDPHIREQALAHSYGWQSFMGVALQLHSQPIGVWFLMRTRPEPFTQEDLELLSSLADYASVAVKQSWLLNAIVREKHESEAVLQASANGILVVDRQGFIVEMNSALERLIGWKQRDARGRLCCDVVGCALNAESRTADSPVCPLEIANRGQDKVFLEYQLQTRHGEQIPVEVSYGLIRDQEGELSRIVMVFRDISRQKAMEHQRAEIVANASHELRTPLALIKGYATTLLRPDIALDEEETRRFLNNVSISADRLSRMIDDLLYASRLELNQLELHPCKFDLGKKTQQVLAWIQPYAKNRLLVADMVPDPMEVWADPDRVEQVLVNLLSNAIKYSPPQSTIIVQGRVLGDPRQAIIHVIDEGVGIAPEHLSHIFERFYVAETSKQGVGLGLYICKKLVKAMSGEIWAISELGRGSTFSFSLPVDVNRAL